MVNKEHTVIDLFAGCGGLSDGFEASGHFDTLACVEWEREPCNTLANRLANKWGYKTAQDLVLRFDIQRTEELFKGWDNDPDYGSGCGLDELIGNKTVDLVIGGPPCQAYSVAGRIRDENGMHDDYRNYLFESYVTVVNRYRPKVFVFENVPGILSAMPGGVSIVERITEAFSSIGYEIISDLRKYALIDCVKYGIPQSRKRVIIVGVCKSKLSTDPQAALEEFYNSILPKYKSNKVNTVRDAIANLEPIYPIVNNDAKIGKKQSHYKINGVSLKNHEPRLHNSRDIATFKVLAEDIENGTFKYIKAEALKELYFQLTGRWSNIHKYHVLQWDKPSNTIPAHLYKDGLRHIHPDPKQARSITVREAARLQTFDDDFEFTGSATDQYKMIGNAVPPALAKKLGDAINSFITKYF
ncbi:DNA cytosine methyltransferase [Olivibacter jilunii]|uniref:DNA cytosine methyltransferase n=1 Tax=Olivibacter jilunii TaxID=985016 RepID=UPI003F17B0FC